MPQLHRLPLPQWGFWLKPENNSQFNPVLSDWTCQFNGVMWKNPETDWELVQSSPEPRPTQSNQEVCWSCVSAFTFLRWSLNHFQIVFYWSIESNARQIGLIKMSNLKFGLYSWRFFFYLSAFLAGLTSLVNVSWNWYTVNLKFVCHPILTWSCVFLVHVWTETLVLGSQGMLEALSYSGENRL